VGLSTRDSLRTRADTAARAAAGSIVADPPVPMSS
jgi:hypothetical protein